MKLNPFSLSTIRNYAENKFVTDKKGLSYFFPSGLGKTGYILTDLGIRAKYLRFYSWAYPLFLFAITISLFYSWFSNNFFFIFVCPPLIFGIGLFVHQLYIRQIVHTLPTEKYKYHDLVSEKTVPAKDGVDNIENPNP